MCILGGLIDQILASYLIDKFFSFGFGYEYSCKFTTGEITESALVALEVQQLLVGWEEGGGIKSQP